jgi:hypothetical protein
VILDRLDATDDDFAAGTGWDLKPQGACRGEVCVPLPPEVRTAGGRIDVRVAAERLRMPLLHDEAHDVWALGPATVSGKALDTAVVPDIELPDVDGNPFKLSSLHGRKVLLVAWASW